MRVLVVAAMAWVAEPSAFADRRCSGDAVAVAVEALGGPKLADVGDRVRLDIERAPRGVEGRITYVTRSGETIGPRVVAASTCAELARSMALVIVMSLNDDATDEPSGAAPTASSDLTPGVVVAPAAPLGIEVRVGRRSSTSQFDVLLGAATDTTGHPALVLGSRWRRTRLSLGFELHVSAPDSIDVGDGGAVHIAQTWLEAVPCRHVGFVALCGVAAGGLLTGEGVQLANASTVHRATFALGGRVEVLRAMSDRVALRLHLEASQALTHAQFLVDQMPAWTSESRRLWLGAAILAKFP